MYDGIIMCFNMRGFKSIEEEREYLMNKWKIEENENRYNKSKRVGENEKKNK